MRFSRIAISVIIEISLESIPDIAVLYINRSLPILFISISNTLFHKASPHRLIESSDLNYFQLCDYFALIFLNID